jgi:hypothetical protein
MLFEFGVPATPLAYAVLLVEEEKTPAAWNDVPVAEVPVCEEPPLPAELVTVATTKKLSLLNILKRTLPSVLFPKLSKLLAVGPPVSFTAQQAIVSGVLVTGVLEVTRY